MKHSRFRRALEVRMTVFGGGGLILKSICSFTIAPEFQSWIVGIWGVLVLLRLARFRRAVQ